MNHRTRDAIQFLEAEHETVRGLLEKLEGTTERATTRREELLAKIEREVRIHSRIEEEIFYPAFQEAARKREHAKLFFEALEEHHVVDLVLPELKATAPDADEFAGKAKVLKDLIEHHAEEEEDEMFPAAKKLMDRAELVALGERLARRRLELEKAWDGATASRRAPSASKSASKSTSKTRTARKSAVASR